ncbi:MAG: hypothetical protein HUJ29_06655 [Gammaproteobacteria bacterium]|nr:hypothetical protein [Gammaproteobacteria bacterium]
MKILVSHIQDEYPLAEVFKDRLESAFNDQFDVDLNNDLEVFKSGNAWLKDIEPLYLMNTMLIVLCSPMSIALKWASFKAGRLDGNRTPLLLICHSGLTKDRLPAQLAECDALDTDEDGFEGKFMDMIAEKTHIEDVPTIDQMAFMDDVGRALRRIEARELSSAKKPLPKDLIPATLLKVLTRLAASTGGSLSAGQLAERTNMTEQQILDALKALQERKLVTETVYRDRASAYTITNSAREFLQQVTLL